jgi:hypothetical protein
MKQLLILLVLLASCTPVRYVYVDPKDSVVRRQRVLHDNLFIPTPLFYNNWFWYNQVPYYRPIVVQPRRPVRIPQRPYPQIRPSLPPQRMPQRQAPQPFPSRPPKWRN